VPAVLLAIGQMKLQLDRLKKKRGKAEARNLCHDTEVCTKCGDFPQSTRTGVCKGMCCNKCPDHGPWCSSHKLQKAEEGREKLRSAFAGGAREAPVQVQKRKELLGKRVSRAGSYARVLAKKHEADQQKEAPAEPSKKRRKVDARAKPLELKQAVIAQALMDAECVPEPVRKMLCSALSGCCSVTGEFHPFQERLLQMLKQTLDDIQAEETRKLQDAANSIALVEKDLGDFSDALANAEVVLASSREEFEKEQAALTESVATLQPCKAAVEQKQEALNQKDAVIGDLTMKCQDIRDVRAMSMSDALGCETTVAKLQEWSLSPEMLEDATLLDAELSLRIDTLTETLSTEGKARAALASELEDAETSLAAATSKQEACAACLAHAGTVVHEHVAACKAKRTAMKRQRSLHLKAVKALSKSQKPLKDFQSGPCVAFKDIIREIEQHHAIQVFAAPVGEAAEAGLQDIAVEHAVEHEDDANAMDAVDGEEVEAALLDTAVEPEEFTECLELDGGDPGDAGTNEGEAVAEVNEDEMADEAHGDGLDEEE